MSRSFDVPERSREDEIRMLNILDFPDFDQWVEADNPIDPDIPLRACLIRESGDEYHARPELSHSQFVKFVEEPAVFADRFLGQPDPDAPEGEHFTFGKQVEHFLFHDEVPGRPVVIPNSKLSRRKRAGTWFDKNQIEYDADNDAHHSFAKAGAAYGQFIKDNPGRTVMTEQEYDDLVTPLEKIRNSVRAHDAANTLLYGDGLRHIAILFTCPFTGVSLRCQLDGISRRKIITDYKTAANNDEWKFAADFYKWKYHFQARWYREAVRQLCGTAMPVVYIVTEKQSKCYVTETFNVSEKWFAIADQEWQAGLVHFQRCVESQQWVRPTHGEIVTLEPPIYVTRQFDAAAKAKLS